MKSMTDFIMEQEQPTVVTESYTDADLVSDYMSLCAASANMACIYECATIVEFCQANDINMPETLVQEGFSEVMSNIWKGIAKFFETIAEWFKGLVQKTSSVVAKAKLQETIAKLQQRKGENLSKNMVNNATYLACANAVLLTGLKKFREAVLVEIKENATADVSTGDDKKYNDWLNTVDNLTADYLFFADKKKIISASGEKGSMKADDFKTTEFKDVASETTTGVTFATTDDLVALLNKINSLKIPENGTKLLKAIDADQKEFKALQAKITKHVVADDAQNVDDQTQIKLADALAINPNAKVNTDLIVSESKWISDGGKTTKKVKECADALAKAYDTVTKTIVEISVKEFKDLEVGKDDKKQYDKDLAAANKDAGRYEFSKNTTLD